MLEPGVVFVWDAVHFEEHVLHHENDPSILWLLVIANGVRLLQQRNQVRAPLVIANLSRRFFKFVLLHRKVRVVGIQENIAHLKFHRLG